MFFAADSRSRRLPQPDFRNLRASGFLLAFSAGRPDSNIDPKVIARRGRGPGADQTRVQESTHAIQSHNTCPLSAQHAPRAAPLSSEMSYSLRDRMFPQPTSDCYNVAQTHRRRMHMPDVKIEWNAGRTQEQKDKVAKAITDALVDIAKAPRENVKISFKDNPV